jgi:hypothetical protein
VKSFYKKATKFLAEENPGSPKLTLNHLWRHIQRSSTPSRSSTPNSDADTALKDLSALLKSKPNWYAVRSGVRELVDDYETISNIVNKHL